MKLFVSNAASSLAVNELAERSEPDEIIFIRHTTAEDLLAAHLNPSALTRPSKGDEQPKSAVLDEWHNLALAVGYGTVITVDDELRALVESLDSE